MNYSRSQMERERAQLVTTRVTKLKQPYKRAVQAFKKVDRGTQERVLILAARYRDELQYYRLGFQGSIELVCALSEYQATMDALYKRRNRNEQKQK